MAKNVGQLSLFEEHHSEPENGSLFKADENGARPESYKGMYAMHKYWSKKPYNLVARYIERFSERSDIVLDPFCGSGVTVTESVRLKRRAIGIDINPVAILLTNMGLQRIDLAALRREFEQLRVEVEQPINQCYYTVCPNCGDPYGVSTHTIWENNEPKELWVDCSTCRTTKNIKRV